MRIEKEKNENIIEISADVKLPGTDILLEKGDKIELLEKEDKSLKESHIDRSMIASIIDALTEACMEEGPQYAAEELGNVLRSFHEIYSQEVGFNDLLMFYNDLQMTINDLSNEAARNS